MKEKQDKIIEIRVDIKELISKFFLTSIFLLDSSNWGINLEKCEAEAF